MNEQCIYVYDNKIDFNFIKKELKQFVIKNIEDGCPCNEVVNIYYSVVKIDNGKYFYIKGKVKQSRILKYNCK